MRQIIPLVVLVLLGLGMVGLIIGTTVNSGADPVPLAPMGFGYGDTENHYQQQICPCKNDWPLATDERLRSNELLKQVDDIPDPRGLSALVPFFGQFIDHEIVLSVSDPSQGLFSVKMTPYDTLLNMTRNEFRLLSNGCREPKNANTPQIDGSTIYGDYFNPDLLITSLKTSGCHLKTSSGNLLPLSTEFPREFIAGDPRNTEHSVLASLHTLWVREHNRLCEDLPSEWTENQRFWKARQIVIAKLQHIIYTEWLPAWFGSQAHLIHSQSSIGDGVRIVKPFSIGAYRIGHSMIPNNVGSFLLPSLFFNRQLIIDNGIEPFLQGAYITRAQSADRFNVDGLRDFLFSAGPHIIGEDLQTRNLFRGRELGMGTYGQIAQCYGETPRSNEPEFYIGLASQPLVEGSSLGSLAAHVIAEQFRRLKENDANFYTKIAAQIGNKYYQEIVSTTLGKVIEQNTGLVGVPKNVFFH